MSDQEEFFQCSCLSEGILATKFDGENEVYLSFWQRGIHPHKLTWGNRLRLIWMVLWNGSYYDDEVILSPKEANRLADWIKENSKQGEDHGTL